MTTTVIVQQPQPTALISVRTNEWSTDLFDCFDDMAICCSASLCFPIFACKAAAEFGECVCLPLVDSMCMIMHIMGSCYVPPVSLAMRYGMRNRFGIQGDLGSDCMYATFCNVCSWCQMAREIKKRRKNMTIISAQPAVMIN